MKHHHETPSFIHIHHLFIIISYYIHNSLSPLYNHHIHYIHYIYHCISMFERKSTNPKTAQPGAIGAEGSRRWRELTSRRGGKIWGTYRQYCGEYRGQYRKIWENMGKIFELNWEIYWDVQLSSLIAGRSCGWMGGWSGYNGMYIWLNSNNWGPENQGLPIVRNMLEVNTPRPRMTIGIIKKHNNKLL